MKTFTYTTRCKTILGDLHTPVSTYLKVRDIFPQSALMESSDYHGSENNRSFIGLNPVASIGINHGTATATYPAAWKNIPSANISGQTMRSPIF